MAPTTAEKGALDALLAGENPVLAMLRDQLASSTVVSREYTGVGFFTEFKVSDDAPRLSRRIVIDDVVALRSDGLQLGFILFVEEAGTTWTLECHTWGDGALSDEPPIVRFEYLAAGDKERGLATTSDKTQRLWISEGRASQ